MLSLAITVHLDDNTSIKKPNNKDYKNMCK